MTNGKPDPDSIVREAPKEAADTLFRDAAAAGFEPVTEEQAEAMRQKLREVSRRIHGRGPAGGNQ